MESVRGVPMTRFRPEERQCIQVHPRHPTVALLTVMVPVCRLHCIFCTTPQGDAVMEPSTLKGSLLALESARERGLTSLFITGGEPTELRWLLPLLREAREMGFGAIRMQSHCGVASDPRGADALVEAGLTGVDAPLYGSCEAVHEAITRTRGSWRHTRSGISELRSRGVELVVHNTLFRTNLPDLANWRVLVDELAPSGAYVQLTSAVGPPGVYEDLAPRWEAIARAVAGAFDGWCPSFPFRAADLPECIAPGLSSHLGRAGQVANGDAVVLMPYLDWLDQFLEEGARRFVESCGECSLRSGCEGVSRESIEILGDVERLQPVRRPA